MIYPSDMDIILSNIRLPKHININDNFWKWFGNSKVIDKSNKPLIVYHGSANKFSSFKPRCRFIGDDGHKYVELENLLRGTIWFSDLEDVATDFSETDGTNIFKKVYPCYLKIENPYVFDVKGEGWTPQMEINILSDAKMNNDGIIIKNIIEGIHHSTKLANDYIVFKANQVKSIYNNGDWDINNNNMFK